MILVDGGDINFQGTKVVHEMCKKAMLSCLKLCKGDICGLKHHHLQQFANTSSLKVSTYAVRYQCTGLHEVA